MTDIKEPTTADIADQWCKGYRDGWAEQGALSTSEPTIPPIPSIPSDVSDKKKWAYEEGKSRGVLDRKKKQAGVP
jgi:hypothetical protein